MQDKLKEMARTLYGKQRNIEKEEQRIREILLEELKDVLTPAQKLYASIEELKKIKEKVLLKINKKLHPIEKEKVTINKTKDFSFEKDTNMHEVLKLLAISSYGKKEAPRGYRKYREFHNKKNGFDGVVYKNDERKEVVIAYRGSHSVKDFATDARIHKTQYSSQILDAQEVYRQTCNIPEFKDYEIYTTGHSLGGFLAQYVGAKFGVKTATFNAYHGTKDVLEKELGENAKVNIRNIVNYRNKEDGVTQESKDNDVGISLEVSARIIEYGPDKFHRAENIGDLSEAEMAEASECVGSYPVSGYTRSDGKEIQDYIRSCGAKHGKD